VVLAIQIIRFAYLKQRTPPLSTQPTLLDRKLMTVLGLSIIDRPVGDSPILATRYPDFWEKADFNDPDWRSKYLSVPEDMPKSAAMPKGIDLNAFLRSEHLFQERQPEPGASGPAQIAVFKFDLNAVLARKALEERLPIVHIKREASPIETGQERPRKIARMSSIRSIEYDQPGAEEEV